MTYVAGAVAGLVLGAVIGHLKNVFIWGQYLKRDEASAGQGEGAALYSRLFLSNIVNIAALAAAFFLRNLFPFDGVSFIVGTAVALVAMNKVLSMGQKKKEEKGREAYRS